MRSRHLCKWVSLISLAICVVIWATSPAALAASKKPIVLKLSCWSPETGSEGRMGRWWGTELEKRSNGEVRVDYYFAEALVKTMDSLPAVSTGIADVQFVADGYFPSQLPLIGATHLLYQTPSGYVMGKAVAEMYETYPPFQKMMKDNNIKSVMIHPATENVIASVKPIRSLEDLKGKKIRGMSLVNDAMKILGATPVAIPLPEVYEALERGTIDAVSGIPYHNIHVFKLYEAAKYIIGPKMGCYATGGYYMNLDSWNRLPAHIKKIIDDLYAEHVDFYINSINKTGESTTKALLAAKCEIYPLAPSEVERWKAKLVPGLYDDWISKMTKKGFPAKEIVETYQKLVQKYTPGDKYRSPFAK